MHKNTAVNEHINHTHSLTSLFTRLLGVIPLVGPALIDLGIIKRGKGPEEKLRLHATFVAIFLVIVHIAMIFGMLNPEKLGWTAEKNNIRPRF